MIDRWEEIKHIMSTPMEVPGVVPVELRPGIIPRDAFDRLKKLDTSIEKAVEEAVEETIRDAAVEKKELQRHAYSEARARQKRFNGTQYAALMEVRARFVTQLTEIAYQGNTEQLKRLLEIPALDWLTAEIRKMEETKT